MCICIGDTFPINVYKSLLPPVILMKKIMGFCQLFYDGLKLSYFILQAAVAQGFHPLGLTWPHSHWVQQPISSSMARNVIWRLGVAIRRCLDGWRGSVRKQGGIMDLMPLYWYSHQQREIWSPLPCFTIWSSCCSRPSPIECRSPSPAMSITSGARCSFPKLGMLKPRHQIKPHACTEC